MQFPNDHTTSISSMDRSVRHINVTQVAYLQAVLCNVDFSVNRAARNSSLAKRQVCMWNVANYISVETIFYVSATRIEILNKILIATFYQETKLSVPRSYEILKQTTIRRVSFSSMDIKEKKSKAMIRALPNIECPLIPATQVGRANEKSNSRYPDWASFRKNKSNTVGESTASQHGTKIMQPCGFTWTWIFKEWTRLWQKERVIDERVWRDVKRLIAKETINFMLTSIDTHTHSRTRTMKRIMTQ